MIQAKLKIKASPSEFGTMAELFGHEKWIEEGRPTFDNGNVRLHYSTRQSLHMSADTNPVTVLLRTGDGNWKAQGEITAQKTPSGSLLIVWANDDDWPLLKEPWELLLERMRQLDYEPQLAEAMQQSSMISAGNSDTSLQPVQTINNFIFQPGSQLDIQTGGNRINAGVDATVGGDVVGKDKITNTTNNTEAKE